jgi:hypothetical protein
MMECAAECTYPIGEDLPVGIMFVGKLYPVYIDFCGCYTIAGCVLVAIFLLLYCFVNDTSTKGPVW